MELRPSHAVDDTALALDLALGGVGFTALSEAFARPFVNKGLLVNILPETSLEQCSYYLITADRQQPLRVRLLVEYLAAFLKEENSSALPDVWAEAFQTNGIMP